MFHYWSVLLLVEGFQVEVVAKFKREVSFTEAAVTLSNLYGQQVIGLRCHKLLWLPQTTTLVEVDNTIIQL